MPLEMPAERSTATSQPVTVCTCTSKALSSGGKFTHMRATPTPADANYELVGTGELSESQGADAPDDDATPSELLGPLLEWPDLISLELNRLDPEDCAMLAQVGKPMLVAVASRGLQAGKAGAVPLKLSEFVGSTQMLAWARANGCPWNEVRQCRLTVSKPVLTARMVSALETII